MKELTIRFYDVDDPSNGATPVGVWHQFHVPRSGDLILLEDKAGSDRVTSSWYVQSCSWCWNENDVVRIWVRRVDLHRSLPDLHPQLRR